MLVPLVLVWISRLPLPNLNCCVEAHTALLHLMPRYLQQAFAFGCEPLLHLALVAVEALRKKDLSWAVEVLRIAGPVGTHQLPTGGEVDATVV